MRKIYNIKEGDVLGSIRCGLGRGHSFIVYGPLINRNSSIIFEGKPIKLQMPVPFGELLTSIK
jgi:propionyl-CoA synthetase